MTTPTEALNVLQNIDFSNIPTNSRNGNVYDSIPWEPIEKALNNYASLLAALQDMRDFVTSWDVCPVCDRGQNDDCPIDLPCGKAYEAIQQATS